MVAAKGIRWTNLLFYILFSLKANGFNVDITLVENAVAKGAVCLDGSPPAYHIDKGSGVGINNWLVHIEGGGWCNNVTTCLARKNTRLGSSERMVRQLAFSGLLSNKAQFNPDFYNWNRVKVRYCDGASFTGDVEKVDPVTNLHFRGARIWLAVIEDLLAKGMSNAENALLSGCSAGGLTSILHCDSFRTLLPMGTKVKCLADAGYFINVKDVSGAYHIQTFYNDVVTTHEAAKNLPLSCTKKMSPSLCFFPQNMVQEIQTPIFVLNAAYDSWQIKNILAPGVADPHGHWHDCKLDINNCSPEQIKTMQGFFLNPRFQCQEGFEYNDIVRSGVTKVIERLAPNVTFAIEATREIAQFRGKIGRFGDLTAQTAVGIMNPGFRLDFLNAVTAVGNSLSRGMFINSCYAHCQSEMQETWLRADSPVLNKTPIAKAVGDWFYDRSPFQKIDCPYPCDSSCHNRVFDPQEHPEA